MEFVAVRREVALLEAENAALKQKEIADDVRWMQIVYFVEKLRMNAVEGGMIAGWLDQLDEILTAEEKAPRFPLNHEHTIAMHNIPMSEKQRLYVAKKEQE